MNARKTFVKATRALFALAFLATACTPAATQAPVATDAPAATEAPSTEPVTITYLVDDRPESIASAESLVKAFQAKNPNITVQIETRGQGSDGDNIVKTRLATGEMSDVFCFLGCISAQSGTALARAKKLSAWAWSV